VRDKIEQLVSRFVARESLLGMWARSRKRIKNSKLLARGYYNMHLDA
tara:strand:+ start:1357 stop:1497 length:141 start_codon:yes stop_codon:yes gene_type:complete